MDKELPISPWPEWKIIEKIGEGSFGKVYKAQRSERGKSFYSAIKVINIPGSQSELNSVRSETGDDRSVREYFRNLVEECIQEVSTMEYFRGNSHIVSVEDFKVMEYLDAIGWEISIRMEYLTSFMDYCAEKQLTEKEVLQLGLDLSQALQYCRKLKIIHRDIKPENIFVSRFGDFKLGDFGIARELERTMSGLSKKGTYSYMAPEMYRGEQYDSRVDIYSLGIVLYKLMNRNRLPFLNLEKQFITYRDKENALTRRMSGETLKKPADAGEEFAAIILKACAYNPDERYQTPEEFYRDLDDLKYGRVKAAVRQTAPPTVTAEIPPNKGTVSQPQTKTAGNTAGNTANKGTVSQPQTKAAGNTANKSTVSQPQTKAAGNTVNKVSKSSAKAPAVSRTGTAVKSRYKKKRRITNWAMLVGLLGLAAVIVAAIYVKLIVDEVQPEPGENMVNILQDEKYDADKDKQKDFASQVETIKERATAIVDGLETYDWIGQEGDKIKYYNHDTGEYMKVLVYPASSDEDVYEEYYYWDEELFFAYIWYDTTAELYYYDEGKLIRWIDAQGICHDNETDNKEYVERGERYWKKSVEELE